MKFETALDLMKEGEKVRRWKWPTGYHLYYIKGIIHKYEPNDWAVMWRPLQEDILDQDWEIYAPIN